jgi:hypothetical protein
MSSKRFTDIHKWRKTWFRKAALHVKMAWSYLCDNCDLAGFWDPDFEVANFQIGFEVNWIEVRATLGDRIQVLPDGKWWITDFIEFQYGKLSWGCKPHKAVLDLLKRRGVLEGYLKGYLTLSEIPDTLPDTPATLSGRVLDKDKDKDKDSGGSGGTAPTVELCRAHAPLIGLPESEGEAYFNYYDGVGWVTKSNLPITNWQSYMHTWKSSYEERLRKSPAVTQNGQATNLSTVWHCNQVIDECEDEIKRIRANPKNKEMRKDHMDIPRDFLKTEALAEIQALEKRVEEVREIKRKIK